MKVAFLSDIHANIEAFETVLEITDRENIDKIFIAGDLVGYYYYPDKVIEICMSRDNIYCIKGNHDQNFLDGLKNNKLMSNFVKKYGYSYLLTKEKLNNDQVLWLEKLPTQLDVEINNVTITIAHGSIYSINEYVYPNELNKTLSNHLSRSNFTVLGHTHYPFLWCKGDKWLVNPGSVGQPRDQSAISSFIYLDTKNKVLTPKRAKFSIENLERDITKYEPNNKYLKNVLTR